MSTANTACWTAPAVSKSWWTVWQSWGQTSCALTDHGVMYGVIDFYRACKAKGIHPVIGCEVSSGAAFAL